MHACRSSHIAPRASLRAAPVTCILQWTLDAGAVTALRRDVMRGCGDAMEFMRVALCADTRKSRVWIGVPAAMAPKLVELVLHACPAARFVGIAGAAAPLHD